jgi:hypothetical protein
MRVLLAIFFVLFTCAENNSAPAMVQTLPGDTEIIAHCDHGLREVIAFARENPELFSRDQAGLLPFEQKREIWNTWKRFLEYEMALEALAHSHRKYYTKDGKAEIDSFYAGYAAAVTQYRYALEFLDITGSNSALDKLLDEAVPEMGLEENSYSKFKFQFLNAGRGLEFAAREVVFASYARKQEPPNADTLKAHQKRIWEMGRGRGQTMTLRNALKVVRRVGFNAWLPIQTGVSEWMGDTKVYRVKKSGRSREGRPRRRRAGRAGCAPGARRRRRRRCRLPGRRASSPRQARATRSCPR